MSVQPEPHEQWDRVASELRAYKESQQRAWGDIDNTALGRYLADESTPEERRHIEASLTQLPELRKLTELVRDVLDDLEPAAPLPVPAPPPTLPFVPKRSAKPVWSRKFGQRAALAAAACVLLGLGYLVGGSGLLPGERNVRTSDYYSLTAMSRNGRNDGYFRAQGARPDTLLAVRETGKSERSPEAVALQFKELGEQFTSVYANAQNGLGMYYYREGDLDRAEPYLVNAQQLRSKLLGPNHPETVKTTQTLTNTYLVALNAPADAEQAPRMAPMTNPVPDEPPLKFSQKSPFTLFAPHASRSEDKKGDQTWKAAHALRERVRRQNTEDVKQSVVPLLVAKYREAGCAEERRTCAHAIGTLGPAAGDAVPDLRATLRKAEKAEERVAAAWALGQMGPAAESAVPDLIDSLHAGNPEVCKAAADALVRLGPCTRQCLRASGRVGEADNRYVREVLDRIEGAEGRVGVNDNCACFSPYALQESQRQILALARRHHLEIYTETVADLKAKDARPPEERAKEVGANGVYLRFCKEPPGAEVVVADALLKNQTLTAEQRDQLRRLAEDAARRKNYDRGLAESVRFLADRVAKVTPKALGAGVGSAAFYAAPAAKP